MSIGKDMAEITILNDDGTYYYSSLIFTPENNLCTNSGIRSGVNWSITL